MKMAAAFKSKGAAGIAFHDQSSLHETRVMLSCRRALHASGLGPGSWSGSCRCLHRGNQFWATHHLSVQFWPDPGSSLLSASLPPQAFSYCCFPHHCHSARLPAQLWSLPCSQSCSRAALCLGASYLVRRLVYIMQCGWRKHQTKLLLRTRNACLIR